MTSSRHHLLNHNLQSLNAWLLSRNQPPYRAMQILSWIFKRRVFDFAAMTDLPAELREALDSHFEICLPQVVRVAGSSDSTRKFLLRLADGQLIETVLIPASPALCGERSDRLTLCISSQVGCAYGCKFCASGLDGWRRNLQPQEIIAQLLAVEKTTNSKVSNIVFMGMGEPFANYENLMAAIENLNATWGANIGARHMTVSTSGLVPRIRDFARQPLQVRLAVSLHGATDEVRNQIMPINRKYPLAELLEACREFCLLKKQFLTLEYILIEGLNDSSEQAAKLASHVKRLRAKVNLIPYNSVEGLPWKRPSNAHQRAFLQILHKHGVAATLRTEKGHDIAAACGQLRLQMVQTKETSHSESLGASQTVAK